MGRLIDADALWMDVIHSMDYCDDILSFIDAAPTVPQWIPVSERLPETEEDVVLCCGRKNIYGKLVRYICIAFYIGRYEVESNPNWDEYCDEYREEDDKYYILEGWYERIHNWGDYSSIKIEDEALMWKPLSFPEVHEEDEKDGN